MTVLGKSLNRDHQASTDPAEFAIVISTTSWHWVYLHSSRITLRPIAVHMHNMFCEDDIEDIVGKDELYTPLELVERLGCCLVLRHSQHVEPHSF